MNTLTLSDLTELFVNAASVRAHATQIAENAKRLGRALVALSSDPTPIDAPPGADGQRKPPTEFLIWEFGPVSTTKGDFLFDTEAAASVMAAWSDYGNRLTFDYEHKAVDPDRRPGDGKAAGSSLLELRSDGLWTTDVRWTAMAATGLTAGEWLYFSPYFVSDEKTGRILELINIALTNVPATKGMTPLVAASRGVKMTTQHRISDQEMEIAKRLGISADSYRSTRAANDAAFRKATGREPEKAAPAPPSPRTETALTADERALCVSLGVTPDAFARQKTVELTREESRDDE
jgi:phage I-like protein